MKPWFPILLTALLFPVTAFAQTSWDTSISISPPNLWPMASSCGSDYAITNNNIDGIIEINVNHLCSPTSTLELDFTTKGLLLKKKYFELRIKGDKTFNNNLVVKTQDGDSVSFPFSYYIVDWWQIIFFDMDSAMKANNFPDSINKEISLWLPNGNYSIDYFYIGEKALPPVPAIYQVKTKKIAACSGVQTVNLSGITIPNRFLDGLIITAEPYCDVIIKDVTILDLGNGQLFIDEATNTATAALQYTPIPWMDGLSDSIIVTLTDTIRHQEKTMGFRINVLPCTYLSLKNAISLCEFGVSNTQANLSFSIYPVPFNSELIINLSENITGEILIYDATGCAVASHQLISESTASLNLSHLPSGLYLVKISDGKNVFVRKIVKE